MSLPLLFSTHLISSRISASFLIALFIVFTLAHVYSNQDRLRLSEHLPSTTKSGHSRNGAHGGRFGGPEAKKANATLDFQEILYISMPYRTDRQDAMALLAASSDLKIKLVPGVDVMTMHPKAKPLVHGVEEKKYNESFLGVWRAHANAWRYMIENDISTALILEDDIDWDINIKEIMGLWNWQLKYNNSLVDPEETKGKEKRRQRMCEYGCDWDELFMGQCANLVHPDKKHWEYHDPHSTKISTHTTPIVDEMTNVWNFSASSSEARVVSRTYGPLCTMGYAVSRMGAMRMLYQIGGWRDFGNGVDNEIAFRTQEGKLGGYTMSPPAFTAWRVGGGKDSDNDTPTSENIVMGGGNLGGWTMGLKDSARKAMARVLDVDRQILS